MAANYYNILGVKPNASQEEIKKAYRRKAKSSHPDINPSPSATEEFVRINEAYEILGDPGKRKVYNFQLKQKKAQAAGNYRYQDQQSATAYEQWVRQAQQRAKRHANMSYEDFKRSRFDNAEATVFFYLQFLIMGTIFLIALLILSLPFLGMYALNWKMLFFSVITTPIAIKVFNEGKSGLKQLRESL